MKDWQTELHKHSHNGGHGKPVRFLTYNETSGIIESRYAHVEDIESLLSEARAEAKEEERERIRISIGSLLQWLNEDRITDSKKMVTNEDIEMWLFKVIAHPGATEKEKHE